MICPSQLSANKGRFQTGGVCWGGICSPGGACGAGGPGGPGGPGATGLEVAPCTELEVIPCKGAVPTPFVLFVLLLLEPVPFEPFSVPFVVELLPVGTVPFELMAPL